MTPDLIGTIGVALLLGAFAANLAGFLSRRHAVYQGINAAGASLAAYASLMIPFIPFVVLEGVWAVVSLVALTRTLFFPAVPRGDA